MWLVPFAKRGSDNATSALCVHVPSARSEPENSEVRKPVAQAEEHSGPSACRGVS